MSSSNKVGDGELDSRGKNVSRISSLLGSSGFGAILCTVCTGETLADSFSGFSVELTHAFVAVESSAFGVSTETGGGGAAAAVVTTVVCGGGIGEIKVC